MPWLLRQVEQDQQNGFGQRFCGLDFGALLRSTNCRITTYCEYAAGSQGAWRECAGAHPRSKVDADAAVIGAAVQPGRSSSSRCFKTSGSRLRSPISAHCPPVLSTKSRIMPASAYWALRLGTDLL